MTESFLPASTPMDPDRWRQGLPGDPQVGDLWVVSWDGTDLGLVLIAAVRPDHVLIWPVTDPSITPSAPCFRIAADWLTAELFAWPEAEAGMSKAVLDRRLGPVLSDRTMLAIRIGMADGELPGSVSFAEQRDDELADITLDDVCRAANALCDIEWTTPAPGASPVDVTWAKDHNLTLVLGEFVKGPPAVIRDIMAGMRVLPADVIDAVIARFDVSWTEFLAPIAGDEAVALNAPVRKHVILDISSRLNVSEAEARRAVWQKSLRAARQQSGTTAERAASRVDQALDDLLAESER